jgi:porin
MGIQPTLAYVTDIQGNVRGGTRQKLRYFHNLGLDLGLDLERLVGWTGASFAVSMSNRAGTSLSDRDIGNVFNVAQVCCGPTTRLVNLWLEQTFWSGRASVRAGRLAAGDEFLSSPLYWLYVQAGIDGNPAAALFNVPYTAYPVATWGARLRALPRDDVSLMLGVFNGDGSIGNNRDHGVDFSIRHDAGVLVNAELGWHPNAGGTGLPGNYEIGGYYHSGRFESLSTDVDGGTVGTSDAPPRAAYNNGGFYVLLDQMVYGERVTVPLQGLVPWVAVLIAPSVEYNVMPYYVAGGMVYYGPIPGRDHDVALFGAIWGELSRDLREAQRAAGEAPQTDELVLEFGYDVQLAPWLHVQPDLQWVHRPGGTGTIPDAVVLGLQVAVNF